MMEPWQVEALERELLDTPVSEWSKPFELSENRVVDGGAGNSRVVVRRPGGMGPESAHHPGAPSGPVVSSPDPNLTVNVSVGGNVVNLPIAWNLSGYPRVDAVCCDKRYAHDGSGPSLVEVVAGTPGLNPVPPAIPEGHELLATVNVAPHVVTITNRDITDQRPMSSPPA
jgi:hypothetical protein